MEWSVRACERRDWTWSPATPAEAPGDASYDKVTRESTGHAEAVKITYDPSQSQLRAASADLFHGRARSDPGEPARARQRPSYRSAIFPQNATQAKFARAFIARLSAAHIYKAPIATRIESGGFYPAEAYHQDFARNHPYFPYIVVNDRPKVAALQKKFPAFYKA